MTSSAAAPQLTPRPTVAPSGPARRAASRIRRLRVPWAPVVFLASAMTVVSAVLTHHGVARFGPLRHCGFFDLKIYRQAAGIVLSGGSLYQARFRLGLGFTYPPVAAVLFTALHLTSLRGDEIAVTAVNLTLLPVIAHCALGLAPPPRDEADRARRTRLAWLGAAAAPWTYPVAGALGFGQIDLLVAALVLIDLAYGRDTRWGGMLIGAAAGLKLTPLIFVAFLLCCGRRRMAARSLGAFALSIALAFDVVPGDACAYWPSGVFDTSRVTGGHGGGGGPADQSLHGAVLRIWGGMPQGTAVWLGAVLLVGVAGLLLAARAHRRGDEGLAFVITAITGLLASPISWPHHWVIVLPGLLLLADAAGRRWCSGSTVQAGVITLAVIAAAGASWSLSPLIAAHPRGRGLGLAGLLVGDLYVIAGIVMLLAAAVVDLRGIPERALRCFTLARRLAVAHNPRHD